MRINKTKNKVIKNSHIKSRKYKTREDSNFRLNSAIDRKTDRQGSPGKLCLRTQNTDTGVHEQCPEKMIHLVLGKLLYFEQRIKKYTHREQRWLVKNKTYRIIFGSVNKSWSVNLKNIIIHIYPTPPLRQDMTQGRFFKRSLTGMNSEFSFS